MSAVYTQSAVRGSGMRQLQPSDALDSWVAAAGSRGRGSPRPRPRKARGPPEALDDHLRSFLYTDWLAIGVYVPVGRGCGSSGGERR